MIGQLKILINQTINLGTVNSPFAERPVIRLVNALGLLGNLTVLLAEVLLIIFMGFELNSLLMSLFYLILFSFFLFLNHCEQWEWSKRLVFIASVCAAISVHFSFPREVASWMFSICVFVLFAAIFKKKRQILIFSAVIIAMSIGSIVLQNLPSYYPITRYSSDDIMGIQIIVFTCSSFFVLLGVLFVKSNLLNQQEQLEQVLKERNTLLKEIHHRVKNNLQVIASLMYLQSEKSDDVGLQTLLSEGQGRVRSMALIHQKMYESENLGSIPFSEYLSDLIGEIKNSFGEQGERVTLNIEAKDIYFDLNTAIPLGLIIHELSTNTFKYAFPEGKSGQLNVKISRQQKGAFLLEFFDDGVGIPFDRENGQNTSSMGLRLIKILGDQLEGEYEFSSPKGAMFTLKFNI